jgi:hypothetical protein
LWMGKGKGTLCGWLCFPVSLTTEPHVPRFRAIVQ